MDPLAITFLGSLGTLLVALKPWAELALKVDSENSQAVRTAAEKVFLALRETENYLKSGKVSLAEEERLQNLWHSCAASLHGVNNSLADLCYLKGEHWKDPDRLTPREINSAGIAVEQVKEALQALLRK
ncbi:MAG: hypothetical protein Q8T09_00650 [Candidatus Melainabacteria bacterium]|nr:hypothetical protein [Candidatus Melainabacteria bacterium]